MRKPVPNGGHQPNDTQTITVYNDPIGGVEIIKSTRMTPGSGFPTLRLRSAVWTTLVDTVITDKNGRVFLSWRMDRTMRGDRERGGLQVGRHSPLF